MSSVLWLRGMEEKSWGVYSVIFLFYHVQEQWSYIKGLDKSLTPLPNLLHVFQSVE